VRAAAAMRVFFIIGVNSRRWRHQRRFGSSSLGPPSLIMPF
jgi:hypothetical protein